MGDAGTADAHGLQEAGDIGGGCLTFHIRVGGQDDLGHLFGRKARQELPDADIIRADPFHRGEGAVKHEDFHKVSVTEEAIKSAVDLSVKDTL